MTVSILTDGVLVILLGLTVLLAWQLRVRLERLRADQAQLLSRLDHFETAAARAETLLNTIRDLGDRTDADLSRRLKDADGAINELSILIHAGDRLAATLERDITRARAGRVPTESRSGIRKTVAPDPVPDHRQAS